MNKKMMVLFLSLFVFSACSSKLKSTETYTVHKDVVYAKYDDGKTLTSDILVPNKAGVFPIVVVVHGGGWTKRTREDMNDISKKLVKNEFVVMNISYRLAPEYKFPAPIVDYLKAVQFIKQKAAAYKGDHGRVGALGYSAGAHIVSLGGLLRENVSLDRRIFGRENLKNTQVKAVVAGGTPSDLTKFPDSELVVKFLGKKYSENPELYKNASPVNYAYEGAPAFFLYHGENDWIVDRNQMDLFVNALKAKRVPAQVHEVGTIGHVATFLFSSEADKKSIDFLKEQLK